MRHSTDGSNNTKSDKRTVTPNRKNGAVFRIQVKINLVRPPQIRAKFRAILRTQVVKIGLYDKFFQIAKLNVYIAHCLLPSRSSTSGSKRLKYAFKFSSPIPFRTNSLGW